MSGVSRLTTKSVLIIAFGLMFAGAYRQWPLYTSNQNTYFLKGLAAAGYGHLSVDWLAQQTDHIPVFSAFVKFVFLYGSTWMFYLCHAVLAVVYVLSLYIISKHTSRNGSTIFSTLLFFATITLLHEPWILHILSDRVPGLWRVISAFESAANLSTNGMAGQYILGPILQPSSFGILLISSVAFFIKKREFIAVVCAVGAATVHPTYLLHAGLLIGAFFVILFAEGDRRKAWAIGGTAAVLIAPIVTYVLLFLGPTHPSLLSQAQTILVEERIPHHAKLSVWISLGSWIQFGIMVLGIALPYRCKRLRAILVISTVGFLLLTLVQVALDTMSLALLFPWRLSTWLVPLSTALVIGSVTAAVVNVRDQMIRSARAKGWIDLTAMMLAIAFLCGASMLGLRSTVNGILVDKAQTSVISFAKEHSGPNQTYLIPLDLDRFRLGAGVPVFIDWKSHPYRDIEVLHWYERVQLARKFYGAATVEAAMDALTDIQEHDSITHIILDQDSDLHFSSTEGMRLVYDGQDARVYELIRNHKTNDRPTELRPGRALLPTTSPSHESQEDYDTIRH